MNEKQKQAESGLDVPNTATAFRVWANRVCGAWPADLQVKAYKAAIGETTIDEFKIAYEQWRNPILPAPRPAHLLDH